MDNVVKICGDKQKTLLWIMQLDIKGVDVEEYLPEQFGGLKIISHCSYNKFMNKASNLDHCL